MDSHRDDNNKTNNEELTKSSGALLRSLSDKDKEALTIQINKKLHTLIEEYNNTPEQLTGLSDLLTQSGITMDFDDEHIISAYGPNNTYPITTPEKKTAPSMSASMFMSGFVELQNAPLPLKHRSSKIFVEIKGDTIKPTFHEVFEAYKKKSKHNYVYFFKRNKFNPTESFMYELEASCCGFYQLIAPKNVSSTKATHNEKGQYDGVSSRGIPGFKSTIDDQLKEEDLVINENVLKHFSMDELEKLDELIQKQEAENQINLDKKADNHPIWTKTLKNGQEIDVTVKDLKNFRILKGLGIGLTASHFFEEDDLHRGNMTKDGKRIDFDMSLWHILYHFKDTGIVDWTFRIPGDRFKLSAQDIEKFPNIVDAQPFYWPTKPPPYIPETILQLLFKYFNITISQNPFQSKENLVYQKLEKNPVFKYYQYATLLKILMTSEEMFINIAKLHIREEIKAKIGYEPEQKLIDILAGHLGKRLQELKKLLVAMPSFQEFFALHGDGEYQKIVRDFKQRNDRFDQKGEPYQQQKINMDELQERFSGLKKEIYQRRYGNNLEKYMLLKHSALSAGIPQEVINPITVNMIKK